MEHSFSIPSFDRRTLPLNHRLGRHGSGKPGTDPIPAFEGEVEEFHCRHGPILACHFVAPKFWSSASRCRRGAEGEYQETNQDVDAAGGAPPQDIDPDYPVTSPFKTEMVPNPHKMVSLSIGDIDLAAIILSPFKVLDPVATVPMCTQVAPRSS